MSTLPISPNQPKYKLIASAFSIPLKMEKTSSNTLLPFLLASFLVFLIIDLGLKWAIGLKTFFSTCRCFFQSPTEIFFLKSKGPSDRKISACKYTKHAEDGKVSKEDVDKVMRKLKFVLCNCEEETFFWRRLGSSELSTLFEDEEPSVDEVKEAFDVFDVNGDGFVDATELQRVLCSLGFAEGSNMKECKKMVRAFDENGDGQIDFNEFVKLMEKSFC